MTTQKDYVDYKYAGDIGTDATASIQPIGAGEAVTQNSLRRPSENLRTRTEIARDALEDLLYYRNRAQYVMQCAGTGVLSWGGTVALGGTGVVDNSTQLTIRPMLTPRSNAKGLLAIGTTTVNAVSYEVQAGAYASDGMNAITVEHRDVTGTVSVTCAISDGPIKRILVVFDSANAGHNSTVTTTAVNVAIGLDAVLNGKLLAVDDGAPGNAILAMAETAIDTRTHGAGTAGNATADVEEHTLAAGALGLFGTPLQEGDVLAIRYDYVVEPTGGDPNDPKGGVAGGRAESNAARANTNVVPNLFIAQNNPEWLPGAIPLVKIVNNIARWIDGTNIAANFPAVPGSALGTNINTSQFQGPPTLTVNGGLLSTDDTLQEAFDTADNRLGQLRSSTWNVTDGVTSTGGHYDAVGGLLSAIGASTGGGHIYVRRGTYTGPPAGALALGDLALEGERPDLCIWNFSTAGAVLGGRLRAKRMYLKRSSGVSATFQNAELEDSTFETGLVFTSSATNVSLTRCTMFGATQLAGVAGIVLNGERATLTDSDFTGPDTLSGTNTGLLALQVKHFEATNCRFNLSSSGTLVSPSSYVPPANAVIRFTNCRIEGNSNAYPIRIAPGAAQDNVKYVFTDCVIVNNTVPKLLYLALTDGVEVHFERCLFLPNTVAVPTAPMIEVTTGNVNSKVTFRDCEVHIAEADATPPDAGYGLIELGHSSGLGGSGVVNVDGLRVVYLSTASGLHSNWTVRYAQDPAVSPVRVNDAVCRRLTVEFNGKRSATGSAAAVHITSSRVEHLHLTGVDYPIGAGIVSLLYCNGCWIDHLTIRQVPVLTSAVQYGDRPVYLEDCYLLANAEIPRFLSGSDTHLDAQVMDNVVLGTVTSASAGAGNVYLKSDCARGVRFDSIAGIVGAGVLDMGPGRYVQCFFNFDDGRSTIKDIATQGDMIFEACEFRIDSATSSFILGNTGSSLSGNMVVGNQFNNVNAAVPTLAAPPATSLIANNLFRGSVP